MTDERNITETPQAVTEVTAPTQTKGKIKKKKNGKSIVSYIWSTYSFVFVFAAILIAYAFTINHNGKTFNWGHIASILSSQYTVIVGTMALGMALVIITGQIDLSVGSALVLCTSATIAVFNITGSVPLMILAALGAGFLCGLINGLFVGLAKMPPFIVTLGTMLIYRSIALYLVRRIDPAITGSSSSQFAMLRDKAGYDLLRKSFGTGSLRIGDFSIPYITMLFLVVVVFFVFISKKTKYGKSVYATGSNERSAHLAGINTLFVKISVFAITGLLVGVASFIQACKIGNVTPAQSGQTYEMYAIAAVVLGGISMMGGRGNMLGVLFGALSYTAINFIIVSVPSFNIDIQNTFQGLVLILVILVQTVGPAISEKFSRRKIKAKSGEAALLPPEGTQTVPPVAE
ncbi:MAG: ABC transporter permease [Clostridiales Family XIII bacterium]|jgi:ribose transport system permease protein|nr:ABC transporter permease [Clostridiales Family XIII bacterium]